MTTSGMLSTLARGAAVAATLGGIAVGAAEAQDAPTRHRTHAHVAAGTAHPLTVHRRYVRLAPDPYLADGYEVPGLVRRWDDPNLYSFYGWRLGGDNFYGDERGETITRGNASLGAIAGYGGARGGYGGPHFDSVGGFHNGPGPEAQESVDYASGSIWRPDYGDIVPHYPSITARVAALNTGIVGPAGVTHAAYAGDRTMHFRASATRSVAPLPSLPRDPDEDVPAPTTEPDDDF